MKINTIINDDCLHAMQGLDENSIDSIVTDPPYGLSFMGKDWDHGIPGVVFWQEALRIAKPGCHLLAFGGTRTFHRLAVAIEDAGWEIRDTVMWVYGSGFPKSLNIGKQGVEGYEGYGTALKPAWEPVIVARKPIEGTVANNVLKWGTGAINIDGCRVETDETREGNTNKSDCTQIAYGKGWQKSGTTPESGRFPANLIHDGSDEVVGLFPNTKSGSRNGSSSANNERIFKLHGGPCEASSGSASRFFYCAKASKSERNMGCEGLEYATAGEITGGRKEGSDGLNSPRAGAGRTSGGHNTHPTVKPLALMRYLVRLVTPPDGVVLDPFCGSGSTLVASSQEGFRYIGIDKEPEYVAITEARIRWVLTKTKRMSVKSTEEETESGISKKGFF